MIVPVHGRPCTRASGLERLSMRRLRRLRRRGACKRREKWARHGGCACHRVDQLGWRRLFPHHLVVGPNTILGDNFRVLSSCFGRLRSVRSRRRSRTAQPQIACTRPRRLALRGLQQCKRPWAAWESGRGNREGGAGAKCGRGGDQRCADAGVPSCTTGAGVEAMRCVRLPPKAGKSSSRHWQSAVTGSKLSLACIPCSAGRHPAHRAGVF
eukprot:353336-Chlamydomonas_euryale.AAC.14